MVSSGGDFRLLSLLKEGDEKAFEAIFKKYSSILYYFSLDLLKNEEEAKEIVQETFIRVWENRNKIKPEQAFNTYVSSIARNKIYDVIRHRLVVQKHSKGVSEYLYSLPDDDKHLWEELFQMMLVSMDRLSERQKQILTLRSRGHSNAEIAGMLEISLRTVETHYSKALASLRTLADAGNIVASVLLLILLS